MLWETCCYVLASARVARRSTNQNPPENREEELLPRGTLSTCDCCVPPCRRSLAVPLDARAVPETRELLRRDMGDERGSRGERDGREGTRGPVEGEDGRAEEWEERRQRDGW